MQHKEAAGTEVTVELDEDLVGRRGHAFLYRVSTELTNLGRRLVGPIPGKRDREVDRSVNCEEGE